ncbi:flotillin-like FloA family protein, partial [Streptococcus danieliae]|nr:flotillin-like FloA family protein [Streptococcus danieliae]
MTPGLTIIFVLIILSVFFTFFPIGLWISAIAAGVKVSIFTLVGMRLRRVVPSRVINPMIKAHV